MSPHYAVNFRVQLVRRGFAAKKIGSVLPQTPGLLSVYFRRPGVRASLTWPGSEKGVAPRPRERLWVRGDGGRAAPAPLREGAGRAPAVRGDTERARLRL